MPWGLKNGRKIFLHNDNHAVNLGFPQCLNPQNDCLQSNKDNDQHTTSFTCFCYHIILICKLMILHFCLLETIIKLYFTMLELFKNLRNTVHEQ